MDLEKHYNQLWQRSHSQFKEGQFELDPMLQADNDRRYGLTLLARPSEEVKQNIKQMLKSLEPSAPRQYYYPLSDLHLTVLSVISCREGFTLSEIDLQAYQKVIISALSAIHPFQISFRGITASPSSILVQGFPASNHLEQLRNSLRKAFKASQLQHSIDARYVLQTAHITVLRFQEALETPGRFIDALGKFRDWELGNICVNELELVGNDWYQRKDNVKQLATFQLGD